MRRRVKGGRLLRAAGGEEAPAGRASTQVRVAESGRGFKINRQCCSALAGTWLFPSLFMAFRLHLGLVSGLLLSIAKVISAEASGLRDEDDVRVACSSGTFASIGSQGHK